MNCERRLKLKEKVHLCPPERDNEKEHKNSSDEFKYKD